MGRGLVSERPSCSAGRERGGREAGGGGPARTLPSAPRRRFTDSSDVAAAVRVADHARESGRFRSIRRPSTSRATRRVRAGFPQLRTRPGSRSSYSTSRSLSISAWGSTVSRNSRAFARFRGSCRGWGGIAQGG